MKGGVIVEITCGHLIVCSLVKVFLFVFFFNSVLRPFQDYFSQSVGGAKMGEPKKNHMTHPQAELGLSHMWPVRGSNPHQTQR